MRIDGTFYKAELHPANARAHSRDDDGIRGLGVGNNGIAEFSREVFFPGESH
jgi:hypothetical protein